MPIPKVIYQTWKYKDLHPHVQNMRNKIQAMNPEYTIVLYDDAEMDQFICENFDDRIYQCYKQLAIGAARADFWRYCVLYVHGGIYLDMDSAILRPLRELILPDDQALVTREGNEGIFNNWILIFEAEHPILWRAIEKCCYNIEHRVSTWVGDITGPSGPWTQTINEIMMPYYGKKVSNLYYETDMDLNAALNKLENPVRCRFYGVDMGEFACWKYEFSEYLYQGETYWRYNPKIFVDS